MKTLQLTIFIAFFAVLFSCSDDENPADNFLGTQDVTLTLNNQPHELKAGEYYQSQNEANCEITEIMHTGNSVEFEFTLENSNVFDRFSFNYRSSFNGEPIPVGQTVENPWFFSFSMALANEDNYYVGSLLQGESYIGHTGYPDNAIEVIIDNITLVINERVSNGNEEVIDGVRQDYPFEKISGVLNVEFSNEAGESQNVEMDFNLEGENIVIEPDNNIFTDPGDDGGNGNGGGGNGGGGADCDNLVYSGPTTGQDMQWCQAAQLYQCLGATTELNYVCDALAQSNVNCSYCN
ncbi:hypothetical protein ULMS_22350 [Patiriisocius marinistellae]|uniref:Lipoprotein n=2 Tax=Patiriisocius marinistellae TaxID=2494560 RepID=A0A5J4FVM3_9FLAO|nr:hypothetical protein ULMS_22350 [Patiriisocius marinistellae]